MQISSERKKEKVSQVMTNAVLYSLAFYAFLSVSFHHGFGYRYLFVILQLFKLLYTGILSN